MPYAAAAVDTGFLSLGSLRYELSKLRAKGLVEKLEHSRRYRLTKQGHRVYLIFLKLFGKLYAPLGTVRSRTLAPATRTPIRFERGGRLEVRPRCRRTSTNSSTRCSSRSATASCSFVIERARSDSTHSL